MPALGVIIRSLDVKRSLDYKQRPPQEIDVGAHIRVMEVDLVDKETSHILLDIVYSMRGRKEKIPLMDARLEIDVIYKNTEEKMARMLEGWGKNRRILPEFYHEIGNSAFQYGTLCMISLAEKLKLPPVIPIPVPISPPKEGKP